MDNSESVLVSGLLHAVDALEAQFDDQGRARWPLLRDGERDEIPALTRRLIHLRDGNRCTIGGCIGSLQLDHIIPWSAYGPDRSDNLRTLCWSHNRSRSNFRETFLPRVQPVVAACDPCLNAHESEWWIRGRHRRWTELGYACAACTWGDWPTSDARISAWCGTCTATSWTSVEGRLL